MKKIKDVLMLGLLVLSAASINAWADTAKSWNLARDMIGANESSPPNFPWSFMQNSSGVNNAGNYTLLPTFKVDQCGGTVKCWQDPVSSAYVAVPTATFNFTGGGNFVLAQGDVVLHPGNNSQTVIRWKSPIVGVVKVLGRINDLHASCGDGIGWSLNLGNTVLQSGDLGDGGSFVFSLSNITVDTTSALYFVLDKKVNYACDTSSIDLLITN